MNQFFTSVLLLLVGSCNLVLAAAPPHESCEIPIRVVGKSSPALERKIELLRSSLDDATRYWLKIGIERPKAPLLGLVVFGDTSETRVIDVVKALRPDMADIAETWLGMNYRSIRTNPLATAFMKKDVNRLAPALFTRSDDFLNYMFEQEMENELGFSIRNFAAALDENPLLKDTSPAQTDTRRNFADSPRILMFSNGNTLIIVPPRMTEGLDSDDADRLASINDLEMMRHEWAHYLIHGYVSEAGHETLPITIHEIFADNLTTMRSGSSAFGQNFLETRRVIAERLSKKIILDDSEVIQKVAAHISIGQVAMRGIEDKNPRASLTRWLGSADPYAEAAPAHLFIESLATSLPPESKETFHRLTVAVMKDIIRQPLIPTAAQALMSLRQIVLYLASEKARLYLQKREIRRHPEREYLLSTARDLVLNDPAFKVPAGLKPKGVNAIVDIYAARVNDAEGMTVAERQLLKQVAFVKAFEKFMFDTHEVSSRAGFTPTRPMLTIDFILPELIRSYYRLAAERMPELRPKILEVATAVSGRATSEIKLADGSPQLVFGDENTLRLPFVRKRLSTLLSSAQDILKQNSGPLTPVDAKRYRQLTTQIKTFEDTAQASRLWITRPKTTAVAGILTGGICQALLSLF